MDTFYDCENQIIDLAISGDKEAFGYLYDHYYSQIFRYLLVRSGNHEDAEDMAEITFIKAWEHVPGFGGKNKDRNFRAWLFRIAHNTIIDHYRTRKTTSPLESIELTQSSQREPVMIVLETENSKNLLRAIRLLDENSQKVIVSRFVSGLSNRETALSIGISENNVRVIQYRALKKIRAILRAEDE